VYSMKDTAPPDLKKAQQAFSEAAVGFIRQRFVATAMAEPSHKKWHGFVVDSRLGQLTVRVGRYSSVAYVGTVFMTFSDRDKATAAIELDERFDRTTGRWNLHLDRDAELPDALDALRTRLDWLGVAVRGVQ
jgi:hypothetical protein